MMNIIRKIKKEDKIFSFIGLSIMVIMIILNIFGFKNFNFLLLSVLANVFLIFIKTAIACKDDYYRLLCAGLAVTYGFQLFLTVGGSIKMIPSTGVTYPLISYGGSSLMSTIFMFFIVQGVKINENKQ